jgi:hypothetical protein
MPAAAISVRNSDFDGNFFLLVVVMI